MEPRKLDCFPFTEDWFIECSRKFKGLSSTEKNSVILSLIDMCDTTARFNLLKSCNKALHCDILAFMPQVALDKILDLLPVPDIINACKVSCDWNKCITQSTLVWKKKWLEMGIGSERDQKMLHKQDWKSECVIAQEIYDKIAGGRALDYELDLFDDDFGYISAMDFCNGKLVLCHSGGDGGTVYSHEKAEWTNLCSFSAATHGYPSVVRLLPSNLMIVGAGNGKITIWRFIDVKPGVLRNEVKLLHSCHGHTSIVLSVDGNDDIGVAVSGSRDSRVKVWSLVNGLCIKTFDYASPVVQVSFFCGENSLLKDYHFLLIHSSEKIFLQSWHCNANWVEDGLLEKCVATDANIMPGIHINNGTLFYCSVTIDGLQRTYLHCLQLNIRAIAGNYDESLHYSKKVISFNGIFRKLLQVGLVFALLIADDNIMAVDIQKGNILFKEYVPYSAATSLTLPQITVGGDKWLDGLLYLKRYEMLLALAIYGRSFTVLSWTTSIPEFKSKQD